MRARVSLQKSLGLFLPSSNQRTFHSTLSSQIQTQYFQQEAIEIAIETKNFHQIPDLLSTLKPHKNPKPNPFSFLSSSCQTLQIQIVDEILQSFISIRPRSRPYVAYSCLLSQTLETQNSLPLSLAILQQILRSGCSPVPQTRLSLSLSWCYSRRHQSVAEILSEMRVIGYRPDCSTCNYLLLSLCSVDEGEEAVQVLKGMHRARCDPDSESYGTVIGAACRGRKTEVVAELVRDMVGEMGLTPAQGTVACAVAAMRANREVRRAVDMVGFLERKGCNVGFESYEMVVEGCVERGEFVLAGKVVMEMARRGLIPYIGVRQRVVEGLASIGERELAFAVRQRLVELKS